MKNLEWSLKGVIPDDAVAAWGARAILKNGVVEILPDRRSMDFPDPVARGLFALWFEKHGIKWIEKKAKKMQAKKKTMGNSTDIAAFDDGQFHIRMSTNASYGYLYISAWMGSAVAETESPTVEEKESK